MSPVGLVPKSEPYQWRLIVDLLHSCGHSITDGIPSELASISYASVDDEVHLTAREGIGIGQD